MPGDKLHKTGVVPIIPRGEPGGEILCTNGGVQGDTADGEPNPSCSHISRASKGDSCAVGLNISISGPAWTSGGIRIIMKVLTKWSAKWLHGNYGVCFLV